MTVQTLLMIEKINAPVRIVLADDHLFFRTGFKNILQSQCINGEIEIVAEAANGFELIECVKLHQPDIVFTDIKMPAMDGIAATKVIKEKFPGTKVIALSALEDAGAVINMIHAGVSGYVIKNTTYQEIITAINSVLSGKAYYCNIVSNKVYGRITASKIERVKNKDQQFSPQEISVIKLICKQLTNKEIAAILKLHLRTVEDYRHRIQEKMGSKNVVGVVLYALAHEIILLGELQ